MGKERIDMRRILMLAGLIAMTIMTAPTAVAVTPAAPLSTAELKQTISAGKKNTVVFFLNPMGGPCKAQNEILQKLHKDRRGNFNIAYVSTMKPEDQRAFYDYGVRSLPTVVIIDKSGTISRYFPPGIQSYESLAAALDGTK
jgi:thioredoxin 1